MDWQQIAALAVVAAAALWLIRTQILERRGGCGGCGSCPSAAPPAARPGAKGVSQLVQIDLDLRTARKGPDSGARRQ